MKKILIIVLVLFCAIIYFISNKPPFLSQMIESFTVLPLQGIIFVGLILLVTTIFIKIAAYRKSYKLMLWPIMSLAIINFLFMSVGMSETRNLPSYFLAISVVFICPIFSFIFSISIYSDQNFNLKRKSNIFIILNMFFFLLLYFVQTKFLALYLSAAIGVITGVIFSSLFIYLRKKRRERYLMHK
jgi:hypothetical protein